MSALGRELVLGLALLPAIGSAAEPVTLRFEGALDTLCIVADYGEYPTLPPPDWVPDWQSLDRDSVHQTTDADGKIQYYLRYQKNFRVELEGVEGIGWVDMWYSHSDYPSGENFIYDATLGFTFRKKDRQLAFTSYGSLFEDYSGAGSIAFGFGEGLRPDYSGVSVYRTVNGIDVDDEIHGLRLTGMTPGVAECPDRETAWKFRYKERPGKKRSPGRRTSRP